MRKRFYTIAALCLALLCIIAEAPAQAAVFHSDVRVKLSLGKEKSFSFTPVGEFTLLETGESAGDDELTVSAVGGRVSVTIGGETVTAPSLTFKSGNYGGLTDYIRLVNDEHGTCTYLGDMTFDVSEGYIRAINTLPLEQYLYGVVPHEMSNSFPLEALKAQAVCARGYAVAKASRYASSRSYDLVDTSSDQVYRGYASKNKRCIAAVDQTAGQVLTYEGDIIEAFYSASNGGQTERTGNVWENDLPYYAHADDPYDLLNASSLEEKSFIPEVYDDTTRKLMDPAILYKLEQAAYDAAGREVELISTVSVTPKDPSYDAPSRCYTAVDITLNVGYNDGGEAKTGQVTVSFQLDELEFGSFDNNLGRIGGSRTRLRMRGAERGIYNRNGTEYPGWYLTVRRYGHGVGLSQRSAQERARAGQTYDEIMAFYYVDTTLNTVGSYATAPRLSSDEYEIEEWGISDISPGTEAEELLKELESEGSLTIVNRKGSKRSDGDKLCTGDFVRTTYQEGLAFFDLPVVIYGDLDGDGDIDGADATALQQHLLRSTLLSGPHLAAADVNHDDDVDFEDLIHLIRYAQGDERISQKG